MSWNFDRRTYATLTEISTILRMDGWIEKRKNLKRKVVCYHDQNIKKRVKQNVSSTLTMMKTEERFHKLQ